MTATIISTGTTFGSMTNQVVGRVTNINMSILRLQEAVATASSGYTGTPGTEFELGVGVSVIGSSTNNFGITPNPDAPGEQGLNYSYAINQLAAAWATFWNQALPYLQQLDNGITPS